MPTSSQARILSRDQTDFGTFIRQREGESDELAPYKNTQHLAIPRINLQSGVASYITEQAGTGNPHHCHRLSAGQERTFLQFRNNSAADGAVNISNNGPNNDEPKDNEQAAGSTPASSSNDTGAAVDRRKSSTETTSGQGQQEQLGMQEQPTKQRRRTISHRPSIAGAHPVRPSRVSTTTRKLSHQHSIPQRRKSQAAGPSRRSTLTRQQTESFEDYSDSETPNRSFHFEIDLLQSSRRDDPDAQEEEEGQEEVEEEKPKLSIKALYKQLLTIGMSSNAFRGIVVKRESGETTGATEKEAENALEALVSDIHKVDEEDEEEEEEEDVELVMGSLLCDISVPAYIEVTEQAVATTQKKAESAPSAERKKPPSVQPEPPKKETTASGAAEENKVGSYLAAGKPFAEAVPLAGYSTDIAADFSYAMAPPSTTPPPLTKEQKEAEEQKRFLQQVATGSVFKTPGNAKKGPQKPEGAEAPKKKVLKLPPIRLRKSVPPSNPHLLCFRTPTVELTHIQIKNMLESQLGNIVSLQCDPEYLQNGDVQLSPRVMWIFKMEDVSDSNYIQICDQGVLGFDAERLRIRKRDDTLMEEHRAYLLVQQIKEEQNKRARNKNKAKAKAGK